MVKEYLLSIIFIFISIHQTAGQNVKRAACNLSVSISADYCTNPGKVVLTANSVTGVSYLWSTGATTKDITVDVAGFYSVTITDSGGCSATDEMSVGQELVTNGDFTAGNTGFTSGYAFKADVPNYNQELVDDTGNNGYGIGTDGQNYHSAFFGKDHTNNQSGDRNFMLVNGHGSIVVWEETVSVEPNTNYYYSAWGMNLNPTSPARLQFEVNGVKIGTIADLNNAPKPAKNADVNLANWIRFYYGNSDGWNSGSATTAVIRIIDLNADLNGNDFGLDDISFATLSPFLIGPGVEGSDNQVVCPGTSIQPITYKVGSGGPPSITGLPPGVSSSFDGLTLTINGTPSMPGSYQFKVATTGCTIPKTALGTIEVKNPGVWTGVINNDWNNAANWCCGSLPTNSTDVEIIAGLVNYPNIAHSSVGFCNNLFIDSGASLTVSNGGRLQIGKAITNSGTFDAINGTIEMNGSDDQIISGDMFKRRTIKNLIVSNTSSAGLSISSVKNDSLKITGTLSFGNPNGTLNTGDNLTLVSTNGATANVGKAGPGNSIKGKAIVERYINIGSASGQHGKSWQFLSAPVSGQTIKQSWMENGNNTPGYGMQVTGPAGTAAGFDLYSVAPSAKYYNVQTNSWTGISSPGDLVNNPLGYMVFVRGDRTVTTVNQAANTTTLRAKGTLALGTLPAITISADHFQSIGNPYASAIDFTALVKSPTVDDKFYVWDPYLYGTYGVGGYQVLSSINGWKPVPGGTSAYPSGISDSIIQSGQAFFVHSTSSGTVQRVYGTAPAAITFTEDAKVNASGAVNFTRKSENISTTQLHALSASLFTGPDKNDVMADGNVAVFGEKYSDKFDRNDALKITNSGENFGLKAGNRLLSIEARGLLTAGDTLYYHITHLARRTYQLRFAPVNLQSTGLQAFLSDDFLKTETAVSLSDSSFVEITITSDPASSAANRFTLVFREMQPLPVKITFVSVSGNNHENIIHWNVENENGIQQYEVERSADGKYFTKIAIVNPLNDGVGKYTSTDNNLSVGPLYYRVKSISLDGEIRYSRVVIAKNNQSPSRISVHPNPIKNDVINLELNNRLSGVYKIVLYNSLGQVLIFKEIFHTGGLSKVTLHCHNLPGGIYQLHVGTHGDSEKVIKIIK